jgi:hypothetical protein
MDTTLERSLQKYYQVGTDTKDDAYHDFWCLLCDGYIGDHTCICTYCGTDTIAVGDGDHEIDTSIPDVIDDSMESEVI